MNSQPASPGNRPSSATAADFVPSYDADGNQIHIRTSTGTWDAAYDSNNRPVAFTKTDEPLLVECGYDYMGRRFMKKVTQGGMIVLHEQYLYRDFVLIAILDMRRGGMCIRSFLWDPSLPARTQPLLLVNEHGETFHYIHDLTKNVTELLDAEGNIAVTYDYAPYGAVVQHGPASGINPIQWSSEYYDEELGLVYYNFRYYNPVDGRWLNRDPTGERGGLNLYAFADNNPVMNVDLLGLMPQFIFDETRCISTMRINMRVKNATNPTRVYMIASRYISTIWNNNSFKINLSPTRLNECCPCPEGIKPIVQLGYVPADQQADMTLYERPNSYQSYSWPVAEYAHEKIKRHPQYSPGEMHISSDALIDPSLNPRTRKYEFPITLAHEFGHYIGLLHPGQDITADLDAYHYAGIDINGNQVDGARDVMGTGTQLRSFYFRKWGEALQNETGCSFTIS